MHEGDLFGPEGHSVGDKRQRQKVEDRRRGRKKRGWERLSVPRGDKGMILRKETNMVYRKMTNYRGRGGNYMLGYGVYF